MRVLVIGDIVGRPGRECVAAIVPGLKSELAIDFIVANAENCAGGFGVTVETANELFRAGINVLTTGDHVWSGKGIERLLETDTRILRPANYPHGAPGNGWGCYATPNGISAGVVNLLGVTFMQPVDSPFVVADSCISQLREKTSCIIMDIHAEATSEKGALARYVDGKVSAVIGTHTHVQTADEQILPCGTAFLTDVGMTGPIDSVLGMKTEVALQRFLTRRPHRYVVADGLCHLNAVVVDIDEKSGLSKSVSRIQRAMNKQEIETYEALM